MVDSEQNAEREHELAVMRQEQKAAWLSRRLELMNQERELLTKRNNAIGRMGEEKNQASLRALFAYYLPL